MTNIPDQSMLHLEAIELSILLENLIRTGEKIISKEDLNKSDSRWYYAALSIFLHGLEREDEPDTPYHPFMHLSNNAIKKFRFIRGEPIESSVMKVLGYMYLERFFEDTIEYQKRVYIILSQYYIGDIDITTRQKSYESKLIAHDFVSINRYRVNTLLEDEMSADIDGSELSEMIQYIGDFMSFIRNVNGEFNDTMYHKGNLRTLLDFCAEENILTEEVNEFFMSTISKNPNKIITQIIFSIVLSDYFIEAGAPKDFIHEMNRFLLDTFHLQNDQESLDMLEMHLAENLKVEL